MLPVETSFFQNEGLFLPKLWECYRAVCKKNPFFPVYVESFLCWLPENLQFHYGEIYVPWYVHSAHSDYPFPLWFPQELLRLAYDEISEAGWPGLNHLVNRNVLVQPDLFPIVSQDPAHLLGLTVVRLPLVRLAETFGK